MTKQNNISKEVVIQAIIEVIEREHENPEIRALHMKGYEAPYKIIRKGKDPEGFVPDVMYHHENRTELYEVELDKKVKLGKWRLFSLFSKKGKGKLNIITPKEHLPRFRELLKSNDIHAKLIYF